MFIGSGVLCFADRWSGFMSIGTVSGGRMTVVLDVLHVLREYRYILSTYRALLVFRYSSQHIYRKWTALWRTLEVIFTWIKFQTKSKKTGPVFNMLHNLYKFAVNLFSIALLKLLLACMYNNVNTFTGNKRYTLSTFRWFAAKNLRIWIEFIKMCDQLKSEMVEHRQTRQQNSCWTIQHV
jgi:hypothetical protein